MSAPNTPQEYRVDPARFEFGTWCHDRDRQIGEGDISASYSADTIGLEGRVRKPFVWQNALWVNTGTISNGPHRSVSAYSLIPVRFFEGEPQTYNQIVQDNVSARKRPEGFYHGMSVKHGKQDMVLIGPSVTFVPSEDKAPEQIDLLDLL